MPVAMALKQLAVEDEALAEPDATPPAARLAAAAWAGRWRGGGGCHFAGRFAFSFGSTCRTVCFPSSGACYRLWPSSPSQSRVNIKRGYLLLLLLLHPPNKYEKSS